jgi:hypothetical protein
LARPLLETLDKAPLRRPTRRSAKDRNVGTPHLKTRQVPRFHRPDRGRQLAWIKVESRSEAETAEGN